MKNTVIVQVNYSFKGEDFTPSITLELDAYTKISDNFAGLHTKIAQQNKIDTYSYAFDAMEAYPLTFHSPEGNVIDYVNDGECDLAGYKAYLKQSEMMEEISQIATDILGITDINQQNNIKIKEAMISSYNAGIDNIIIR
jgi:hypothetical protein